MAKQKISKQSEPKRTDWCRDCAYNLGEGSFGYMHRCSLLGYCVVFSLGYCNAEKLSKGTFKEKMT